MKRSGHASWTRAQLLSQPPANKARTPFMKCSDQVFLRQPAHKAKTQTMKCFDRRTPCFSRNHSHVQQRRTPCFSRNHSHVKQRRKLINMSSNLAPCIPCSHTHKQVRAQSVSERQVCVRQLIARLLLAFSASC